MAKFKSAAVLALLLSICTLAGYSQESETKVIDEVVAQVNDGVITLSRVNREIKDAVDSLVSQGKSKEEAEKMVEEKRGELIANMINEELLLQKGKEIGVEADADAQVNQRFVEIMKQYNVKTLDQLYKLMEGQGVDPQDIRDNWRRQAIRDGVIRRDVQQVLYWEPTGQQLKKYFDNHKDKFTTPESVTLSEIFLSFAGHDPDKVRAKAKDLITQLRAGGDWNKAVADNSDRADTAKNNGKVDSFNIKDLDPKIAKSIEGLKTGDISDPIEQSDEGLEILKIDERVAASDQSKFDENAVRMAIMSEKFPDAQKKYMSKLREDAYVKISDSYRPLVSPILFAEERSQKTATTPEKTPQNKP